MIPRARRADPRAIAAARPGVVRDPWGVVRFVRAEPAGIAIVVPKKAARRAVDRHRAKRRFAAALLAGLPPGHQLSATLTAAGAKARGKELRAWCDALFARILGTTAS